MGGNGCLVSGSAFNDYFIISTQYSGTKRHSFHECAPFLTGCNEVVIPSKNPLRSCTYRLLTLYVSYCITCKRKLQQHLDILKIHFLNPSTWSSNRTIPFEWHFQSATCLFVLVWKSQPDKWWKQSSWKRSSSCLQPKVTDHDRFTWTTISSIFF